METERMPYWHGNEAIRPVHSEGNDNVLPVQKVLCRRCAASGNSYKLARLGGSLAKESAEQFTDLQQPNNWRLLTDSGLMQAGLQSHLLHSIACTTQHASTKSNRARSDSVEDAQCRASAPITHAGCCHNQPNIC